MLILLKILLSVIMMNQTLWASSSDSPHGLCSSNSDMSISSLTWSPISSPSSSYSSLPSSPMQVRSTIVSPVRSPKIECCLGIPLLLESTRDARKMITRALSNDASCGFKFNKVRKNVRFVWLGSIFAHQESDVRAIFNEIQTEYAQQVCGTVMGTLSFNQVECMQSLAYNLEFIQFVSAFTAAADKKGISRLALPGNADLAIHLGSLRRASGTIKLADVQANLTKCVPLKESQFTIGDLGLYFEQDFEASDR